MGNKAILAIIRGRVQGVGFRYEARNFAKSLGLTGWIYNLPDGGVETYAEGPASAVDRYLQWLHQGPPGAHVTSVDVTEKQYTGSYASFTIELY
ncbi:MAG TPA: acylphosphatase [Spirochaetia bacterium]|nr:acylphosphatase [Spirochaetales bacterium]HRS64492.1 acylphosphatase [Spirochaetia bacterium]HOT58202.1 acylphosphatase [Spirochaetales bacterium]HPD81107.1 acylphosphatase [Spirochaetales bacterium]HQK34037.1 acylphosphatase [Spirochaetales bacterium]